MVLAPVEFELAVRAPADITGVLQWMRVRALPGMESGTAERFARTLRLPGGPAWFEVRADEGVLGVRARLADPADRDELIARLRRLFDLDTDPHAVDAALARHPELAPRIARRPGIRLPGAADPHELLIRAMVGQQISVASARTALSRLVEELGERVTAPDEQQWLLFPTMSAIAARGHEVLRGPGARIRAITGAAEALADGSLALGYRDDPVRQRAELLARPGIGPWTADYVRMRVLQDPDVVLPGDSAVRAGARRLGIPAPPRELAHWAQRASPWRSYLMMHLWKVAAGE